MSPLGPDMDAVEAALGVSFRDRSLLLAALTHRSYLNETDLPDVVDNERLEYLGDALLDFVTGSFLFRALPDAPEGELTAARAALVCETALAGFARQLDLGRHMRVGRGEDATGGRERPALLCDVFEAVVGALYLDRGLDVAERFALGFLARELAAVQARRRLKDAKSLLQELTQRLWQVTPRYRTVAESGPEHDKRFVVAVEVDGTVWATGTGRSKAVAARRAAQRALARRAPRGVSGRRVGRRRTEGG